MEAKGEHILHPVCEACGKVFANTHQLSGCYKTRTNS
jgi:hypothetical protein